MCICVYLYIIYIYIYVRLHLTHCKMTMIITNVKILAEKSVTLILNIAIGSVLTKTVFLSYINSVSVKIKNVISKTTQVDLVLLP